MSRKNTLLIAAAATLALLESVSVVYAQSESQSDSQAESADRQSAKGVEEIVVTGIAGSLKSAVQAKRQAPAITDSISAEDIGKFPDKNAAESLSHVPGISIDHLFGQGERVAIRGTDPALNRTLLNGQTVASADWFILDVPGRTFNYSLLAPQIIQRIDVYKSPEARIDEGSIGGTVIVRTREPLDLPSNTFRASLEYSYNDNSDDGGPNYTGIYNWKNDEGSLGVLVSFLHSDEQLQRDGIETFSYPDALATGFNPAVVGNNPNLVFPNAINAALFQQKRTRDTGTVGIEIRPSDKFELNFTGLFVNAKYNNFNQSRYAFVGNGQTYPNATSATVRDGVITAANFSSGLTLLDAIARDSEVDMNSLSLRANWYGDDWTSTAVVGSTKADGGTSQQYFLEYQGNSPYGYTIGDKSATVTFGNNPADAAALPEIGFGQSRQQPTHDEEQYARVDYTHTLLWGPIDELEVGVDRREHETWQHARLANIDATALAGQGLANFTGGVTPSGFLSGVDSNQGLQNWMTASRGAVVDFVSQAPVHNSFTGASVTTLPLFPSSAFDVQENISSAYSQFDFKGQGFRGNLGLRVVQTDQTSNGFTAQGAPGVFVPNSVSKTYADWLPSLNIAFNLSDDVILRLAASRTIARANFSDLASYTELLDTVNSGSGGNPNLDPYRSSNFGVSGEWYMGGAGLFSVAGFYKDIRSFIVRQTGDEQHFNILTGQVETYSVTRPRNGAGGAIRGVEVAYQNSLGHNFGLQVNYTFADGKTDEGLELPFSSKNSYNLTPYFDNGHISARVTYGWRSKYFREIGRNGVAVTNDAYGQLDLSFGYKINDNFSITAQVLNMLDELDYQYAGVKNRPLAIYDNGRRFFAGVRFTL